MENIHVQYCKTKIGELILGSFSDRLCLLDFRYRRMRTTVDNRLQKGLSAGYVERDDEVLESTREQLGEYLRGDRREFDIPLLQVGTEFQKRVWDALRRVPYGTTSTYAQLADRIHHAKAVRAVANANGANAIAVMIPCHRIIGSDGGLVGYGGGLPAKKRLLKLERDRLAPDLFDSCIAPA